MLKNLKIIGYQFLFVMIWFSLIRLVFLFTYFHLFENHSVGLIFSSFLYGLKFDFRIVGLLYGLLNLPLFLPFAFFRRRIYLKITAWAGLFIFLVLFYVQAADLGFYNEVGRRLGHEFFGMVNDIPQMAKTVLLQEPLLSGVYVVVNILLCVAWYFLWKKILPSEKENKQINRNWFMPVYAPVYLIVMVIGVRGGFQPVPLFIGDAFRTPHLELGHLTLNGPATIFLHLEKINGEIYSYMPVKESQKIVRGMISNSGNVFPSDKYTFFRSDTSYKKDKIKKKNVILLMMESWASYLLDRGDNENDQIFPFLNELRNKSLYFDNFYASGTRSMEGLAAQFYGMAGNPDFTFVYSPYEQNSTVSMAQIYNRYGYNTEFIFGIFPGSFGMHELARNSGFQKVITQYDMPGYKKNSDSTWGVWDGFSLDFMIEEANRSKKPFFFSYFSVTTHKPFELPDKNPEYNVFEGEENYWKNVFRYSDFMLRKFFEKAAEQPWYKDTIFIVTADHTSRPLIEDYNLRSEREKSRIPFLIFDPSGELEPQNDKATLGSQVDILPTLIDYHGFDIKHNSMGKSLLSPAEKRFALNTSTGEILFITPERSYFFIKKKPMKTFDLAVDPLMSKGKPFEENGIYAKDIKEYKAYLQESNNAILQNRLAPFEYYQSLNQRP